LTFGSLENACIPSAYRPPGAGFVRSGRFLSRETVAVNWIAQRQVSEPIAFPAGFQDKAAATITVPRGLLRH